MLMHLQLGALFGPDDGCFSHGFFANRLLTHRLAEIVTERHSRYKTAYAQRTECSNFVSTGIEQNARHQSHNPKVVGSNPTPATNIGNK